MTMIPSSIIIQIYLKWLKDSLLIIIMSVKLLVTVLCALKLIHSQQIVDYSHSSYLERRQAVPHHNYKIDIHPSRNKKDYLQFPTSCELEASLSVTALVEQNQRILDSEEKQIQRLKTNMTYLLKLAQNIKRAKTFLRQYAFNQEQIEQQIDSAKLESIESIETSLQEKRQQIDKLIKSLAQFINKQLNSTKTNGWDNIHLEFQQKIYLSRLNYLLKLRESLQKGQKSSEKNFDQFFRQIQVEINQQNEQISGVGEVLGNYSSSNELRLKISTLESQLEGLNLMIKQRQECIQKKDHYSNETRKQLQRTYNQLKELKKREDPNRQFCEGVATSLLKQLKKLLKVYNYSFACAEGLPELQNSRVIILLELQRLNKIYNEINYDNKIETIRSYFSKQKELRAKLIQQIHIFKLDHYALDTTRVESQISATRNRLTQIAQKLKNPNAGKDAEINYDQIRQIIVTIEKQQHAYCVLKSQYQEKYRSIDVTLRSIELQTKLRATHYSTFVAKYNELRQLQREFLFVKNSIAEQLK